MIGQRDEICANVFYIITGRSHGRKTGTEIIDVAAGLHANNACAIGMVSGHVMFPNCRWMSHAPLTTT